MPFPVYFCDTKPEVYVDPDTLKRYGAAPLIAYERRPI